MMVGIVKLINHSIEFVEQIVEQTSILNEEVEVLIHRTG